MPEWKKVTLHSDVVPPMRYKSSALTMNDGNQVYVFGGLGTTPMNQIWCLDVESHLWKPIVPKNRHINEHKPPLPRLEHSMTDTGLNSFIIFGGRGGEEKRRKKESGTFSGRTPHEGEDTRELRYRKYASCEYFNDVIEFNISEGKWYNRLCYGQVPMRRAHTLTLVTKENYIPITEEEGDFSDVEDEYNNDLNEGEEEEDRNSKESKFRVETIREMYAIGGATINRKGQELSVPDLWILNLDTYEWRKQPTSGKPPARINHTTTNIKNKLYVIGGVSTTTIIPQGMNCLRDWGRPQADVAVLDTDNYTWTTLEVDPFSKCPPPIITSHCAAINPFDINDFKNSRESIEQSVINFSSNQYFQEDSILIFGGKEESDWSSNIYRLGLGGTEHMPSWSQVHPSTLIIPPIRYGHIGFVIPKTKEQLEREEAQRLLDELKGKKKKKYSEDQIAELQAKASKEPKKDRLVNTPALVIFGGSLLNGDPSFTSSAMYALESDQIKQKLENLSDDEEEDEGEGKQLNHGEDFQVNSSNTGIKQFKVNNQIEIIKERKETPITLKKRSFSAPSKRNDDIDDFNFQKDFSHLFSNQSSTFPTLEGGLSKNICSWEYNSVKKSLQINQTANRTRPMTTPAKLPTTIKSLSSASVKSSSMNNRSKHSIDRKSKKKGAMLTIEDKISSKGTKFGLSDLNYIKRRNMDLDIDYTISKNASIPEPKPRKTIYERKIEFQRNWEKKRQLDKLREYSQNQKTNANTLNAPVKIKNRPTQKSRQLKSVIHSDAVSELAPSTISTSSSLHFRWHVLSKRTPTVSTGK